MMLEFNIPSEAEQEEAWEYVCKKELTRPDTNVIKVSKHIMVFVFIKTLLALITSLLIKYYFLDKISFLSFDFVINDLMRTIIIFGLYIIVGLIFFSKKAIIGLVRLYQHYAPERVRRKCIFKPTCSEYMILALEKYGLIRGLYKGIYRMLFKCKGFYYSIDYP
jgi:putative component of membrane protein insertase Oxa1/YidC/SpoIIIJ protein YidD